MYKPVDPKADFPTMELGVLDFWAKRDIFGKSLRQREKNGEFVLYDGPPFATGLPHFGHFLPSTIKDVIPRYKTMKGFSVPRRFGWDCHGLPVENLIEKELGLNSKTDIEKYGIAKFNEACRASVLRYVKEWRETITRLGRWVDFDHDYKTMDPDYMESIWWVVKSLWDKGLIEEGFRIMPYCPRCSTVLSNHELAQEGVYRDVNDPAVTVKFKSAAEPDTFFLAWTTTPWTLPSNLALALGPEVEYVKVHDGAEAYILARERLGAYYKEPDKVEIEWSKNGAALKGAAYEPLFPYFADAAKQGAFRVVLGDFVSTEDGTGIVHTAPGFGEDDYAVLKGTGVPTVCPVDAECRFTAEVADYTGVFVKDADKAILERLKAEGRIVKRDRVLHAYPHCWRCESPLVYRAVSSWFVRIEPVKHKMLNANDTIHWVPEHIKTGRFGKWLENARDWSISRNRYWGNPIPVWKCGACGKAECVGSRAELKERSGKTLTDLHKHFVDEVTFPCSCGGTMKRIPEVLDCWFESGSMPYAQCHYPFENKAAFEAGFPADFISESLDQTRGWFYTLIALSAALFDKPAFQNCIVSGMVLAADGQKMSKSKRNFTDPAEVIAVYGADALRLFLMSSAVIKAEDLRFSDDGVKEILKSVIIPLWNAYGFFVTYAVIDKAKPEGAPAEPANPLDRWILSCAERLVEDVTLGLDGYEIQKAVSPMLEFIDLLNNWYIRRSRRRFWRSGNDADKAQAYGILHSVLMKIVLCAAPIIPFITEEIYRNLRTGAMPESVHLCDFPSADPSKRDLNLEKKMETARRAVGMGRALRSLYGLKNRQPLAAVHLVTQDLAELAVLTEMEDLIREELNVKKVKFRRNEEELVTYRVKANFKVLGRTLGKDMKEAAALIEKFTGAQAAALLAGKTVPLAVGGRTVTLDKESVVIQRLEKENLKAANEGTLTVAVDPTLTPELVQEGLVRDLVRGIQNLRKEKNLDVVDRIVLALSGSEAMKAAIERFEALIREETLAVSWKWAKAAGQEKIECGEETCLCAIEKAS
ncbi:MAG: isoleucine--tRNA ligase [Spirochaetales bacterium]|nr:isoleucine--tRNA ligase [Spirochaetales bacterium]